MEVGIAFKMQSLQNSMSHEILARLWSSRCVVLGRGVELLRRTETSQMGNSLRKQWNKDITKELELDITSFKFSHIVGVGAFSTVRKARLKCNGTKYAVKEIPLVNVLSRPTGIDTLFMELKCLSRASNAPFLCHLHFAFVHDTSCFLGFDLIDGGDLHSPMHRKYMQIEKNLAYMLRCLGEALFHLHERGIIHRDIKPANILLTSRGVPQLTDFGVSWLRSENDKPVCKFSSGTLPYAAPEVLTPSHCHSFQADFWSSSFRPAQKASIVHTRLFIFLKINTIVYGRRWMG